MGNAYIKKVVRPGPKGGAGPVINKFCIFLDILLLSKLEMRSTKGWAGFNSTQIYPILHLNT